MSYILFLDLGDIRDKDWNLRPYSSCIFKINAELNKNEVLQTIVANESRSRASKSSQDTPNLQFYNEVFNSCFQALIYFQLKEINN